MRVFVGVSYNRDHETSICGVSDSRDAARRLVELARNEMLHWSRDASDGPDGGSGLDDSRGDYVGHVLAFDVECKDEQAIETQKEYGVSWPSAGDYSGDDRHGRLLWLLKRMLNPEDLGRAVPAHVRDEVRVVLGMNPCESGK